jgi:hypothetical protein
MLKKAAAHFGNVQALDMNDAICPGGLCHAKLGDKIVFRDSLHITAAFSGSLAQVLGNKLQPGDRPAAVPGRSGM